jgi:serine phosphatase RsbU (regulator of sigma subunit)
MLLVLGFTNYYAVRNSNQSLSSIYKDRVVPSSILKKLDSEVKEVRFMMSAYALELVSWQGAINRTKESEKVIAETFRNYGEIERHFNSSEELKKASEIIKKHSDGLLKFIARLQGEYARDVSNATKRQTIAVMIEDDWPVYQATIINAVEKLLILQDKQVEKTYRSSEDKGQSLLVLSIGMLGFSAFIQLLFSTWSAKVIDGNSSALLQATSEKARMQSELETARLIQKHLLPPHNEVSLPNCEIASFFRSASECGGDWWTYFLLDDGSTLVLVGDVTGHGTPAAMVTAVVKGYTESIRTHGRPLLLFDLLTELNQVIFNSSSSEHGMTLFAVLYDPHLGEIHFCNGGHNPPFFIKQEESGSVHVKRLMNLGSRLGFSEAAVFAQDTIYKVKQDDIVVIFSDGLIENKNPAGKEFGEKPISKLLKRGGYASAAILRDKIIEEASHFYDNQEFDDDVTLCVFKITKVLKIDEKLTVSTVA